MSPEEWCLKRLFMYLYAIATPAIAGKHRCTHPELVLDAIGENITEVLQKSAAIHLIPAQLSSFLRTFHDLTWTHQNSWSIWGQFEGTWPSHTWPRPVRPCAQRVPWRRYEGLTVGRAVRRRPGSGTQWVWENNSHSQFVIIVCTCSHLFSMITFWRWSDYEFIESHFSKSITLHQSVVWYEHELTHALRCSEHCIIWAYADDFEARREPWGKQSKTRWREGTQKQREEYLENVVFWIMPTDKDTPFQLK